MLGAPPKLPEGLRIPARPAFVETTPDVPVAFVSGKPPSSMRAVSGARSPLDVHPAFFAGEVALANGVYYLALPNTSVVGYYGYVPGYPQWLYHFDMGYLYTIDANDANGGIYLWDLASGHWLYTSRSFAFPYLYDFTLGAVVYYFPDTANAGHYTKNPRYFFNYGTGQIVTIPSALPAPQVGYLGPASAGSLDGILNNVSTGVTFVGISAAKVSGKSGVTIPTSAVAVTYGPTVLSARRSPLRAAVGDAGPHGLTDLPPVGPEEFAKLKQGLRPARRAPSGLRRTQSLGTTLNSTASFWVAGGGLGSIGGSYTQRSATLDAVTAHGYIWIDNSLNLSSAVIAAIGDDFENAWASDTTHFGTPTYSASSPGMLGGSYYACDANGTPTGTTVPFFITPADNKIVVFVVDIVGLGTGVGGYFSPANYIYQAAYNCQIGKNGVTSQTVTRSNEAPMIFVGYNTNFSDNYETNQDLVRGTAHEFQHEINFVNHDILNAGTSEEPWINEGMSMLAQDLAVFRKFPTLPFDVNDAVWHAQHYLSAPQSFSLTGFTGPDPKNPGAQMYNCPHCYGLEYLYQRYLYDRFGGDAYLKKMLGSQSGYANLQQATGADPTQTISDFAVAIAASGTGVSSDPRFRFTTIDLRSTYTDQFGDVFPLSGPATQALATGTYANIEGSFFYLSGDATAAGKTVSAKDVTGAFQLRAGVVQH